MSVNMRVNDADEADSSVIRLSGPLTIGTAQQARDRLLDALRAPGPVTVDCAEATAFDIAFIQLLESARILATRQGTTLRLAQPLPPRLAEMLAAGGFRGWDAAQDRSAA
ncbi:MULTISPECIES: STAS domain-containing protein [Roseomonadaceae]|uniref:STAS domain-containing protein n=1 Tax=Falsiroseomonas oleicola TaxID=2801474 RepID=A0ABS6H4D8_9PROT|nr:STAS domain-containing protein [Roseomonas oleicola]MBU8543557.1 STAS domain-containing protein [Roseomonas oleicola]